MLKENNHNGEKQLELTAIKRTQEKESNDILKIRGNTGFLSRSI